jgi:YVTN family beta-propeller protein
MLLLLAAAAATTLAASAGARLVAPIRAGTQSQACAPGSVRAVIAGKTQCLTAGHRCAKRLDPQYHRYGFHCHTGRLRRARPSVPAPPAPPSDAPPGPLLNVVGTIDAPGDGTIEAGDGQIWVASVDTNSFMRIDPVSGNVIATVAARSGRPGYYGIGIGDGSVWLSNYEENTVSRLDPRTNEVTAVIPVGEQPEGIAVTQGAVWVADHHGGSVTRIDPATNHAVATIPIGPSGDSGPHDITFAAGSLWVDVPNIGAIVRIDPVTNRVLATIALQGGACRVVAGDSDGIWVAGGACGGVIHGALTKIDPATNAVASQLDSRQLGGEAAGVAVVSDSVWVAVRPGLVVRVARATGDIVARFSTSGAPQAFAFANGSLWLRKIDQVVQVRP